MEKKTMFAAIAVIAMILVAGVALALSGGQSEKRQR